MSSAGDSDHSKSLPIPAHLLSTATEGASPWLTPAVEREHVQRVYDTIAPHWHGTRYQAWPRVAEFIASLPRGSLMGDFGCGNGKNLPSCNAVGLGLGVDVSGELAKIAHGLGLEVCVGDVCALPFRANAFDAGLCIAVLHHLSTPQRRALAVAECMRATKLGGSVLFYAWALEQEVS